MKTKDYRLPLISAAVFAVFIAVAYFMPMLTTVVFAAIAAVLVLVSFVPRLSGKRLLMLWIALALYTVFVLGITVISRGIGFNDAWKTAETVNVKYIPFQTTVELIMLFTKRPIYVTANLFGNIFILAPYGFLMPELMPVFRKRYAFYIFAAAFDILIETSQLVFNCGYLDIDDFIFNIGGAVAVYELYRVAVRHIQKRKQTCS